MDGEEPGRTGEKEVGEEDGEEEDGEEDGEESSDSGSETSGGRGPTGGAIEERPLLKSFDSHVAHSIAEGGPGTKLKLHHHATYLNKWPKISEQRWRARVDNSGLASLFGLGHYTWCKAVRVSSLVERWHPETNSFHLGFGEMTITLDDVVQLIGLSVTGAALFVEDDRDPVALLVQVLGVSEREAKKELGEKRRSVSLDWLRRKFGYVHAGSSDARVDNCARAYLMYVLGCTIFTNKEGARVRVNVLSFLADLDGVRGYAWGAAALAYLYRELGFASRKDGRQIAGFLTLLEVHELSHISHIHFPTYLPVILRV